MDVRIIENSDSKPTDSGDEHYVTCTFKRKINPEINSDKALSALDVNTELGVNWSFRNARFSISDEETDKIEKIFLEKL